MSGENATPRTTRHWLEYVSTFVAVVISVVSLWVAIGTEDANRKMVSASSWPFLQVETGNVGKEGEAVLTFELSNAGVGPAKVRNFEIVWRGKHYRSSNALLRDCCVPPAQRQSMAMPAGSTNPLTPFITGDVQGTIIRACESPRFMTYALRRDNAVIWNALDRMRTQFQYRMCYCSVFDECWSHVVGDQSNLNPVPVKQCPAEDPPYRN